MSDDPINGNVPGTTSPETRNGSLKLFLAHSSDPEWKSVVDEIIEPFLSAPEIECTLWSAESLEKSLLPQIQAIAGSCDALVAVVTSATVWPAIEAIRCTLANDAKARNNLSLFVEKSLAHPVLNTLARSVVYFERSKLAAIREQQRYVKYDLLRLAGDYVILKARKRVRILRDGDGIVTYTHMLRVTNKPNNRVVALSGRMAVTPDVLTRAGHGLPLIREMSRTDLDSREHATFTCRILSAPTEDVSIKEIIEENSEPDSMIRAFLIILNRALSPGELLRWGWGFTFPKLFSVDGPDTSTYRAPMAMEAPVYEIEFEIERSPSSSVSFKEPPTLTIHGADDRLKVGPLARTAEMNLCYMKYVWSDLPLLSGGDKITAAWDRSKAAGMG